MNIRHWLRRLWSGQIQGSTTAAATALALAAMFWIWATLGRPAHTPTLLFALVWIYVVGTVGIATLVVVPVTVRLLYLRLRAALNGKTPAAVDAASFPGGNHFRIRSGRPGVFPRTGPIPRIR